MSMCTKTHTKILPLPTTSYPVSTYFIVTDDVDEIGIDDRQLLSCVAPLPRAGVEEGAPQPCQSSQPRSRSMVRSRSPESEGVPPARREIRCFLHIGVYGVSTVSKIGQGEEEGSGSMHVKKYIVCASKLHLSDRRARPIV